MDKYLGVLRKNRQADYKQLFDLIKDMRPQKENRRDATCTEATEKHCDGNCGYYIVCLRSALAKRLLSSRAILLYKGNQTYNDIDDAEQVSIFEASSGNLAASTDSTPAHEQE